MTIFRVDNPHTKPLSFWQRLLAEFRQTHPEVLFLAEAFTRPAMMRTLGAIGFHQSYTYFAWRTGKQEIGEYLMELAYETDARLRPAFWPTTHDILTPYMQQGGAAAFAIRAVLAATGSPTWGIYSGYELVRERRAPGRRGADRQREVRVQGARLVRARRAWASPTCSARSTPSGARTRRCSGCATCTSTPPTTTRSCASPSA